jgi:hypothetical protein
MNFTGVAMIPVRFRPVALFVSLLVLFVATAASAAYAQAWNEFSYASDGFAVSAASVPELSKQTAQSAVGPVETRIWTWDYSATAVVIAVADYPTVNSSVQEVLTNAANGEAGAWKDGKVTSRTPITLQGVSGVECVIDGSEFHGRSRIFFQGRRLWQMLSLAATGAPLYGKTDQMFASFRFVRP